MGCAAASVGCHGVVPVKVNALVDCGIAPLVAALSRFEGFWTVSSCEGHGDFGHVHFGLDKSAPEFAGFIEGLSSELGARVRGDGEHRVALEWTAGGERPLGTIVAHREVSQLLSKAVRRIAASFDRTSPFRRGIRGTRPHNLRGRRDHQRPGR